eukprot:72191_1
MSTEEKLAETVQLSNVNDDGSYDEVKTENIQVNKQERYNPVQISKISFLGANGKYASVAKTGDILCDQSAPTYWFLSIPVSDKQIKLKTMNGQYTSKGSKFSNHPDRLMVSLPDQPPGPPLITGEFKPIVQDNNPNLYALQSDGKYLSLISKAAGTLQLVDKRSDELTENEKFEIQVIAYAYNPSKLSRITISSAATGKSWSRQHGDDRIYDPSQNTQTRILCGVYAFPVNADCMFMSLPYKDEGSNKTYISLVSNYDDQLYVTANSDGTIQCTSKQRTEDTKFEVIQCENGNYMFKDRHDNYLSIASDEYVVKSRKQEEEWCVDRAQTLRYWTESYPTHFGNINTSDQTFRVSAQLWVSRELSRGELSRCFADEKAFEPDFRIKLDPRKCEAVHQQETWVFGNRKEFVVRYNEGLDCYYLRRCLLFTADFIEPLNVRHFPFDVQHYEFSIKYRVDTPIFDRDPSGKKVKLILTWVPECSVYSFHPNNMVTKPFESNFEAAQFRFHHLDGGNHVMLRNDVVLRREWKFYFWNVIFILCVISFMTLSVFTFGDDSAVDRINFVSTMFLTAVAYLFIVSQFLPKVDYLTLLNWYTNFVIIFMLSIVIETVIVGELIDGGSISMDESDLDDVVVVIYLVVWVIVHVVFIIYSMKSYKIELAKIHTPKEQLDVGVDYIDLPIKPRFETAIAHSDLNHYWEVDISANKLLMEKN